VYFEDKRETGETLIRQCQLVMLRMMKAFDHLCAKHNISYFLIGGSLLGAIRHKGFIPWDDDLDIGMTRDNYDKFEQYVVPELPNDIFFQTHETDPAYPACDYVDAKLRDKYSRYTKNKFKYHDGLQLDIFVYDRAFFPSNFLIILENFLLSRLKSNRKRAKILKWIATYSPFKMVYTCNYLHKWGQLNFGKFYIRAEELISLERVPFEDMEVFIPKGWHECLQRQYGNYMQLPPVEKRVTHHEEQPDPFNPCDHKEILYWTDKN
jgi:lipopolysaccharide cholinephosphotransferase